MVDDDILDSGILMMLFLNFSNDLKFDELMPPS